MRYCKSTILDVDAIRKNVIENQSIEKFLKIPLGPFSVEIADSTDYLPWQGSHNHTRTLYRPTVVGGGYKSGEPSAPQVMTLDRLTLNIR